MPGDCCEPDRTGGPGGPALADPARGDSAADGAPRPTGVVRGDNGEDKGKGWPMPGEPDFGAPRPGDVVGGEYRSTVRF